MGELKEIRDQQETLLHRAKTLSNKLYLAGLGAYSKVSDGSEALYNEYLEAGSEAYGEDAEGKSKVTLAGRGFVVSTRKLIDEVPAKRREIYEQFINTGKEERGEKADDTNEFVLAGLGDVTTLRQESQKLFDDLVSAGEKQQA